MKILFWGSRSLTWKHLPLARALAHHALMPFESGNAEPPLTLKMLEVMAGQPGSAWPRIPSDEPLVLLSGDGPPGKERGAIGADKLCLLACMETWPEARADGSRRRSVRWFPVEPEGQETWAAAAHRRSVAMGRAKPDRAYCIHTDLDSSKGSIITADELKKAGRPFWYVRTKQSGELVSVELRS